MHPYTLLSILSIAYRQDLQSLDFIVNKFFRKLIRTSDASVIRYCQEILNSELLRTRCQDFRGKCETEHCNIETVFS